MRKNLIASPMLEIWYVLYINLYSQRPTGFDPYSDKTLHWRCQAIPDVRGRTATRHRSHIQRYQKDRRANANLDCRLSSWTRLLSSRQHLPQLPRPNQWWSASRGVAQLYALQRVHQWHSTGRQSIVELLDTIRWRFGHLLHVHKQRNACSAHENRQAHQSTWNVARMKTTNRLEMNFSNTSQSSQEMCIWI